MLKKVIRLLKGTISERGNILFVNQKVQMSGRIFKSASRCGQAYSVGAWVGGALTNYKFLYEFFLKEYFKFATSRSLGFRAVTRIPTIMFVSSLLESYGAIREAQDLFIPLITILDTNCPSSAMLYPIPGNDDSSLSVSMYNELVAKLIVVCQLYVLRSFRNNLYSKLYKKEKIFEQIMDIILYSGRNINGYVFSEEGVRGNLG